MKINNFQPHLTVFLLFSLTLSACDSLMAGASGRVTDTPIGIEEVEEFQPRDTAEPTPDPDEGNSRFSDIDGMEMVFVEAGHLLRMHCRQVN